MQKLRLTGSTRQIGMRERETNCELRERTFSLLLVLQSQLIALCAPLLSSTTVNSPSLLSSQCLSWPPALNFQAMAQLSCLSGNSARLAQFVLQSDDPKIHPRLTSSLSFGMHFNSECKTRRHTVLCHLISQAVDGGFEYRL